MIRNFLNFPTTTFHSVVFCGCHCELIKSLRKWIAGLVFALPCALPWVPRHVVDVISFMLFDAVDKHFVRWAAVPAHCKATFAVAARPRCCQTEWVGISNGVGNCVGVGVRAPCFNCKRVLANEPAGSSFVVSRPVEPERPARLAPGGPKELGAATSSAPRIVRGRAGYRCVRIRNKHD